MLISWVSVKNNDVQLEQGAPQSLCGWARAVLVGLVPGRVLRGSNRLKSPAASLEQVLESAPLCSGSPLSLSWRSELCVRTPTTVHSASNPLAMWSALLGGLPCSWVQSEKWKQRSHDCPLQPSPHHWTMIWINEAKDAINKQRSFPFYKVVSTLYISKFMDYIG